MRFDESRRSLRDQVDRLRDAWQALASLFGELSIPGPADGEASGAAQELLSSIAAMASDVELIATRVHRETVNIGVVGRAGAGKSTLLQSITGLGDAVIPAVSYRPATAAASEIINIPGPSRADVTLLTWGEFRDDYLAPLHRDAGFPAAPSTPDEFASYPYESIQQSLPSGSGTGPEIVQQMYVPRLRVAQESFPSYRDLLTGRERVLRIQQLADLRPFVSYPADDADRHRPYHAVRGIRIYCEFPSSDAADLVLVDLPGTGEAGRDIDGRVLQEKKSQVDVLLQVIRPSLENAFFSESDWEVLGLVDTVRMGADRSDFISIVINHDPARVSPGVLDAIPNIREIAERNGLRLFVVNAADPAEVRARLLDPLLGGLSDRLADMDRAVVHDVASRASDVAGRCMSVAELLADEVSRREGHVRAEERDLLDRLGVTLDDITAALGHLGVPVARRAPDDESVQELARRAADRVHAGFAPDSPAGQDLLGVENDVATLCQVLLAKDVDPPISVGLFGDWGTGKSFFMSQMREHVSGLATQSRRARLEGAETGFCSEVRQVVFNAWHYMDANLWATLAGTIFDSLADPDDPYRGETILAELDSIRGIRDELKRRRAEAEKYAEVADQSLREQRIGLADLARAARISVDERLLTDKLQTQLKDELQEAGVRPDQLAQLDLRKLGQQLRGLRRIAFVLRRGTWPVRLALLAGLAIAVFGTVGISLTLQHVVQAGLAVVIGVVASAIPAAALLSRALGRMSQVSDLAQDVVQRVDENRQAPIRARQQALARLVDQYEEQIIAATARIELLEGSRSVRTFIEQRHATGEYRRHEGVVSAVRRDLEQLSRLLTASDRAGSQTGPAAAAHMPEVDRIILYIDDLDRCPAEHVVKVLQAIHLLLAFPLFVVVVGVDARWLLSALRQHYRELLEDRQEPGSADSLDVPASHAADPVSTSYDYLEKIFQIPICLRPMSAQGYSDLIRNLVAGHRVLPSPAPSGPADAGSAPAVAPDARPVSAVTQPPSSPAGSAVPDGTDAPGPVPGAGEPVPAVSAADRVVARRVSSARHGARVAALGTDVAGTQLLSIDVNGQVRAENLLTPVRVREAQPVLRAQRAIVASSGKLLADTGDGAAAVITGWTFDVLTIRRDGDQTERMPVVTAISPDGRTIAVRWDSAADQPGSADPVFATWNVLSSRGEILLTDRQAEPGQIHLLTRTWQLLSRGRHVELRSANPKQPQAMTTELEQHEIAAAATNDAGTLLCTVDTDRRARVWAVREGALTVDPVLVAQDLPTTLVSVGGQRLAVASGTGFQIWDLNTRTLDLEEDGAGLTQVSCLHLTEDGRRLVTGHDDGAVVVWLVSQPSVAAQAAFHALEFEDHEIDFLLKMQPLIATPRAAKRLTNLYRILRAGLPEQERAEFLSADRGYQVAIILLAVVISSPGPAAGLIGRILAGEPGQAKFTQLLENEVTSAQGRSSSGAAAQRELMALTRLERQVRGVISAHGVQDDLPAYRYWCPLVARFSFRSDDQDLPPG